MDSTNVDLVDMEIDTREKLDAWIQRMGFDLDTYKESDEFKRALKVYPYLKDV